MNNYSDKDITGFGAFLESVQTPSNPPIPSDVEVLQRELDRERARIKAIIELSMQDKDKEFLEKLLRIMI